MIYTLTEICNEFNVTVEEAIEYVQSENLSTIVHTAYEIDKLEAQKYFARKKDVLINLSEKVRKSEAKAKTLKENFLKEYSYEKAENYLKNREGAEALVKGINDYRALIKPFDRLETALKVLLDSNNENHESLYLDYCTHAGSDTEEIRMYIKLYKKMVAEKWEDINTDLEFSLAELLGIEP